MYVGSCWHVMALPYALGRTNLEVVSVACYVADRAIRCCRKPFHPFGIISSIVLCAERELVCDIVNVETLWAAIHLNIESGGDIYL